MTLLDFFDRAYVINLPERIDRRAEMVEQLALADLEFAPGEVELFEAVRPAEPCGFPTASVRGCYLSHLEVMRRARAEGLRNVLVLEDDLDVSPLLRGHTPRLIERLRKNDWGVVYPGHALALRPRTDFALEPWTGPIRLAHFYAVNGPVIPRLIAYLEECLERPGGHPDGGPMHVDGAISMFRARNPDVLTLAANPSLGGQRSSRSDIHPSWFDELPGLRPLAAVARRLKRGLLSKR